MMNNVTPKIIQSIFVCVAMLTLTRCDFIFTDDNKTTDEERIENNEIAIQKDEAKLLVEAAQDNLDIIELINVVKEVETDSTSKHIASIIEKNQLEIIEEYNKTAKENVISIPNYPNINKKEILAKESVPVNDVLHTISVKLNKQIDVLNTLSSNTNNRDFKQLAVQANKKLYTSLDKTLKLKNRIVTQ
ncbi:hypothetical protein [Changchengzhania lutea]|uniref:hypothetical protein n=1 Tax=Changchengzhania lutea TaxID=2049305 RepID=UPI00115CAE6F|nr:hypothetical protein [Changchengzhania lutea]